MHRRNSTNPRRPDRRKSTTSVKSVRLEHIPPETAERDARIAATHAFTKARERSATDSNSALWPPSRSSCSNTRSDRPDGAPLCRQQSIRFVQPRHNLAPSSIMAQDKSPSYISHDSNRHVTSVKNHPRPSSSAAASGMVYATKGAAGDYINTLFTRDEYYTPEDDIASMPSSYRKLRKSRSMFTKRPTVTIPEHVNLTKTSASANQLPLPAVSYFRLHQGDENVPPRRLKTPRSMSFLREFRDSIVPAFRSEDDTATFTSRNGYFGNRDRPRDANRPKSSNFFRSKIPSQDRVFRKSMRDASNSTASMNGTTTKTGSLRYKARRVSQGFKHKLKNLFGLGKNDSDDARLPLQHIDAQRSHVFDWENLQDETDDELCNPPADRGALSRVASGIPSLHAVPSYQQLRSRQGSMDSLRSEQDASDERSRVTSWSNSDTNTVITYNSCREERERKRLSIINENGVHMCSSSAQFTTISEQSNASTASLCQPVPTAPATVDGRRIYSALMKRVGHSQQAHTNIPESNHSVDDLVRLGRVPRRKSSLRLRHFGYDPAATIRYVSPESEADPESPKADDRLRVTDQASPSKSSSSTAGRVKEGRQDHLLSSVHTNTNAGNVSLRDASNSEVSAPSMEIPPPIVRTLSSRSSAFFGSPTRHLFRTQSPYRRVLQDRMHTASNEQAIRSPEFNPWMRSGSNLPNIPIRRSSTYGSDADIKLHYTESIYSTNTEDGQTKRHSFMSLVEDFPRPTSTHGDVTIFVNQGHNKRSSSLPPKQRVTSSSSSVEWKMWLSSNVSKLEETTTQVDSNDFQHGLSSARLSGHVRENAQIYDEEDKISDPPDTPSRVRASMDGFSNLGHDDEDDNQPTPFDAGDRDTEVYKSQLYFRDSLSTNISRSNVVSPAIYPKQAAFKTSTEVFAANHEKELPRVPSLHFKASDSNGYTNIATKFMKRQPNAKSSMTPLTSRSLSSTGESQTGKTNGSANSRRKLYSVTSAKSENVSPTAISDDDPYGIEGAGVLGPNQQTVGSKRMVDIFLSSRRRRMASDEGSVFL
ncbi:hypothetical protein GQX73_g4502 [Xylaria multiplex]|uniref:Uncharacterized protein n=1 Tax=Xylaria multiplex TaxID=323545 RepID=A0A7C8N8D4_9PEZI|nr:hypothetical protein GQX73_g4502 [Xylaria multiplex]